MTSNTFEVIYKESPVSACLESFDIEFFRNTEWIILEHAISEISRLIT